MDLREKIPERYSDILPVCPCGCEGKTVEERPPFQEEKGDYHEFIRRKNPKWKNATAHYIERIILYNGTWNEYEGALVHQMRHIRHLFPWVTHDPNLVRLVREAQDAEDDGRKMLHMIGHASSGKTHFMVIDAFRWLDVFPRNSECFVASPYRSASEYLLWNAFNEVADQLKAGGISVFKRANVISFGERKKAGPGTITLVSFHAVGVLRGKKLVDPNRGRLGIYLDEAGEFVNDAILHIIANLKSQRGFRLRTGTNFRSITGLDGRFNQPDSKAWTDLSRELDYKWNSVNGGRTLRMRAKVGPNIILGEDYYQYLLRADEHKDLLAYGVDSPYYLAQGDAFPSVKSMSRLIITEQDIQGGASYEPVNFRRQTEEQFAFADPSFTLHGDCSVVARATLGTVADTNDIQQKIKCNEIYEVPVSENREWDEELLDIATTLRGEKGLKETFELGKPISVYDLNAVLIGKYLLDHKVPFNNFGFDDSMRGQVTASFIYFLGEGVESVYYGNKPTNKMTFPPEFKWTTKKGSKQRIQERMRCDELYTNLVSQMWLVTAAMLKAGYIRDAFYAQRALDQMQLRLKAEPKANVANSIRRIAIESKDEYKDRNRNESPDFADGFCGVVWMIVDRRMSPKEDVSPASMRGGPAAVEKLLESGVRREPRFRQIYR